VRLSTLADRAGRFSFSLAMRALLALLVSPLFAVYGTFVVVRGGARLVRRIRRARLLMRPTIRCASCGEDNALAGRWRCGICKAEYHGFVGVCGLCGTPARAFPCTKCRITIALGLD
jgi:hypothetical protein